MLAAVQACAGYMLGGGAGGHARAQTGPYQLWLLLGTPELYTDSMGRQGWGKRESKAVGAMVATTRTGSHGHRTLSRPSSSHLTLPG